MQNSYCDHRNFGSVSQALRPDICDVHFLQPSWEEEMSQGLFGEESDGEAGEDRDDSDDESGTMLPAGGSKERKTAKEKRKANERKKEVNVMMFL
jgi:hypothetical protein